MKWTNNGATRRDKLLQVQLVIGLLELLFAPVLFAQTTRTRTIADSVGDILIAQAAVSSPVPRQSPLPQVLPPLPQPEGTSPSPAPSEQLETTSTSQTPRIPSLNELDQMFKQSSLGKEADEARLHQQWRNVSNSVRNDPDLVAAHARAESAKTDLLKRQQLRAYYMMYYDRMKAKAATPELKNYIDGRKAEHLAALAQNKVRPSATPSPSPARR